MKNFNELTKYRNSDLEKWRWGASGTPDHGIFILGMNGATVRVIADAGEGWDHASVSLEDRCPTWEEMEVVKRLLFKEDETAYQLHVPPSDHISIHPFCLHIWRPWDKEIPVPPKDRI